MLRKFHVLALIGFALVACDQKALLQKLTPKDDDAFARHFLDVVRTGDYSIAEQMLDATLRDEKATNGLHELHGVLAHGEPVSVEEIGCNVFSNASVQGVTQTTNLSYQIHFADSWAVGNVYLGHRSGTVSVLASRFQPVPDSLEVLNRFTFARKSLVHYAIFAACLAVPSFILFALVVCIRSRIRRKWLWIIFILFGFVQLRFDWTSGVFDLQPLSFLLFGASAFQPSPYAAWVLGCAIPLGAIIFLARHRKLVLPDATQDA
jgi:hypothetical protein